MAGEKKYTQAELKKKVKAELVTMLDEEGLEADDDWTVGDYRAALLEVEAADEDEADDELDDEAEDEEDDDDIEADDIEADEVDEEPAKAPAKKKSTAKAKTDDDGDGVLAAKQVATLLNTEAKTLRQFFRSAASTVESVGSGGRYEFSEADVPKIKSEFEAWKSGHASRGSKRTGEGSTRTRSRGPKVAEITEVDEVEELEIEELEDEELDDADLSLDEADDEEDD